MTNSKYFIPDPVLDEREVQLLNIKTERYKRLIEPGRIAKLGKKAGQLIPKEAKALVKAAKAGLTEQELYQKCMEVLSKGFNTMEKYAANVTISDKTVVKKANEATKQNEICNMDEICLARAYDIIPSVNRFRKGNLLAATIEGGATGFFGFAGIPFNLVLSTFLFYRAVQSVAMFYGYDVKNNPDELVIAGDVFANAMSPTSQGSSEIGSAITKVMALTEVTVVKQTAKKTWTDMASKGGIPLLLTQIRALANKAASKALEKAGETSLEFGIFKKIFEQIGKKLTKKVISRGVPLIGAGIGAIFDLKQMETILEYADIFYCKRFIAEKEQRICMLVGNKDMIIDVDYQVVEE